MRGEVREDPSDRAITELARRQHGVVWRAQLKALGFGDDAIDWRVRRRRLHRVHHGVYVVGYEQPLRDPGTVAEQLIGLGFTPVQLPAARGARR
ncbi:MAG TPA: type IV toxin-antitoxin system AbiEi family antitoxin domain-containing protein [Thermoleophilaceae bacterium]